LRLVKFRLISHILIAGEEQFEPHSFSRPRRIAEWGRSVYVEQDIQATGVGNTQPRGQILASWANVGQVVNLRPIVYRPLWRPVAYSRQRPGYAAMPVPGKKI